MPSVDAAVVRLNPIDVLAEKYNEAQLAAQQAADRASWLRSAIVELVLRDGTVPPRATKTKALAGEKFELRVSSPVEVTVETAAAKRLRDACYCHGVGRLVEKLFRPVTTFVLADGAHELINAKKLPAGAPRNLRTLFARAVRVRELTPQVEVRSLAKEKE